MISLSGLVHAVVFLIVAGLVFWVLWWGLHKISPPQPFLKVGEVLLILMAVSVAVAVLLSLAGYPPLAP
jgi:heme A synthase